MTYHQRLQRVGVVLAVVLGLVLGFLLILHIPSVQRRIADRLIAMASSRIDGDLIVGNLDYRLWSGDVSIEELVYERGGDEMRIEIRVPEARGHWSPFSGLEVSILRPVVVLTSLDPPPEVESTEVSTDADGPGGALEPKLPGFLTRLEVVGGRISFTGDEAETRAELGPFDFELASAEPAGLSGRLVVHGGRVAHEEDAIRFLGGSAGLRGDGSTLEVENGRFDLDAGRLEPDAEIRALDPFSAEVAVAFRLDAAELGPFLDQPTLRGRVTGNATLVVREDVVTGRGSVTAGNLSFSELGPFWSELRFELAGEALTLEGLELVGYGGSLTADARLELGADGRQTVQARWSELSVSSLLASAGVSSAEIPWESIASGEADLAMTRWDASTLTGAGRLELEDAIEGTVAFTADAGALRARTTALVLPGGALDLDAELGDFRRLAADLHLELGDVGPLASTILPEAWIALSGALALDASASGDVTAPETLQAEAEIGSEGLELNGRKLTLDGALRYRRETLHVSNLVLATPGPEAGWLAARGAIGIPRAAPSSLALTLDAFPLGVLPRRYAVAEGSVSGEVALEGDIRNPDAEVSFTLEDLAYRGVEGTGALSASKSGERLRLQDLDLRLGEGEIHAEGSLNRRTGELSLLADARGLPVHGLVEKAFIGGWPPTLEVVLARADVRLSGTLPHPEGRAEIRLEEVSFRGEELPDAAIRVASRGAWEPESTAEVETEVVLEPGGSALRARTELEGDYATTARWSLPSLPWTALGHAVGWDAVDAILVSGEMETRVPIARPEAFIAEANVTAMSARLENITVATTEPFSVEGSAEQIEVRGLSLAGPGIDLRVDGAVALDAGARPPSRAAPQRDRVLRAEGTLELEPWEPLVPGDALGGSARLDFTFRGTPSRPRLQGTLSLERGRWSDGNVVVKEVMGTLRADGDSVVLDGLGASVLGGSLTAEGELPLPGAAVEDDPERVLRFEARDLDLATLLDGGPDGGPEDGDVRLLIALDGQASLREASLDGVVASGAITSVEIRTPASAASTTAPARFQLSRGRFGLERVELTGEGTDLALGAEGSVSDWSAFARGRLNLLLARAVLSDSVIVSGALELDASVGGGEGELSLEGSSRLREGELVLDEPPLVVSGIQASARLEGGEILLEELEASANGGTLSAEGRLGLGLDLGHAAESASESATDTTSTTSPPSLRIQAEAVRLEYPDGLRSEIGADLELSGAHDGGIYELSGRVVIDHARYGKDLSVERELLRSIRSQTVEIARDPGFASRLRLDVDVDSARGIVVDNNLGQIRAETNVLVTGTAETPEISGTVRVLQGGELTFAGNTYEIEAARVDLVGYPLSPPEIDVRARTETGGYDLVLELSGSLDNLRTNLSSPSDPSLSRADVASLLLTGRTVEQVRGEEGRALGEQAARYLGGGLAELTETGLENVLPVTSITIAPTVVGSETDPGARLSLGQAVSDDLFLTYSIGLDDTQSQLWIIDYDLPESFAFRAVRDDMNEYTGTLSQKLLFDIHERARPVELSEIEGPEISAVRFAGDLPIAEKRLRERASLSAGDRFDYWRGRDDADDVREELRRAGYLGADVLFDTEPASADAPEEASAGKVVLTYRVRAGKPLHISWSGDDPGEDLREDVREAWGVHLPPRAVASDAAARLTYRLQSNGYYDAVVQAEVSESEHASEVLFLVELGRKGSGVELNFEGNSVVEDEELESLFHDPSEPAFFELVETKRDDLRESIQLLYATRGYLNARVVELERRYDAASGIYHVDLRLDEGVPAYVSEVVLDGAEKIAAETLRKELILEPGAQLRLGDFIRDRQSVASFYRGEGFPDARVRSRLRRSAAGFDVVHEIEENERVRVGEIRIAGNVVTDEDLTRDALKLRPGEPLRLEDLIETQSRLYDLKTFRSVDVRAVPTDEPGVRDVVVEVVELPDVDLSYGIRYSTEELWELTGNVGLPNLLGDARRLNFSLIVNRNDQAYRTTYHVPSFFGLDVDTDLFVAREIETDDTLSSRSWSATFQQGRGDRERIRAQWSYTFRRADVEDLALSDDPFAFHVVANRGILTGSLIHDGRDSLTRPSRGWFWNATTQFGAAVLGSDLRFSRLFGQAFYFRPVIGRGVVWASSYRAGIAHPFDDQVLLPGDRFQAGGPNSVRGFPLDQLGPVDPVTGARIGGEGVLVLNQELRVPLWRRFGAVAFYDAGNVYLDVRDFNPLDLRHSLGVGLRVDLPVGLVRVDWARVLNPQPGFDDSRFHFSFGHAF